MARDFYAVLGIESAATAAQIRRAYQRLARRYSPDVNLWDREAQALFDEIQAAYRVLGDPSARVLYDHQASSADRPTEATGPRRAGRRRGDDLHAPIELAFEQAAAGLTTELNLERLSGCQACAARGTQPGAEPVRCAHCDGSGTVWAEGTLRPTECPACGGEGQRVTAPCPACRGRGVAPARAIVRVAIPAGMDTGSQIRLPGEGHAGPFGGPRGDLVVITRVHEDPVFTRKGDNLHAELPVTIVEAVLGARVPVRALGGEVDVVLPPGTQSGQVLRIRGRGMPRLASEGRGDLYVTVVVEIPRGLDARTQELVRDLGRLLPGPTTSERRTARV
ncbi:MAG TPA: J domain-containing protein [Verrucomicrobiae bacterium]|jgi:molecular chaperone DnaJ|nr:J domain-containing protein [Verrucomicrobiae bacterium]